MLYFFCTDNKYFIDSALGFLEKTLIVTTDFDWEKNLRPDLNGALFTSRYDEYKSGNGGRREAPK